MAAAHPHLEAVRSWTLVEPPNIVHDVSGQTELDQLAAKHELDVGNVHQMCGVTPGPRGRPITSVKPGWMLLENIAWMKKDGDFEYVPVVTAALGNFMTEIAAPRADMKFGQRSLADLLNGKLMTGEGKAKTPKDTLGVGFDWRKVGPPDTARVAARRGDQDGTARCHGPR